MIKLYQTGAYLYDGRLFADDAEGRGALGSLCGGALPERKTAAQGTMAYSILQAHNTAPSMDKLRIQFDAMASHDITYVGIIQTARASGLTHFPIPYVLTNCHNSLCAVGGTINEDDHLFGLSAARKYGGIFVPAHMAVIHQYMREMMSGCGKMILGSDSHTRYGALGTMAIGEGGPELVKQLLGRTYDIDMPGVVAVYLTGKPAPGVGPQDVALAIIGAVFKNGYVKNKVMEFVGPGVGSLNVDYRIGIDVMTTETTCLSSIWTTDGQVSDYFAVHGRPDACKPMAPASAAYYDGAVEVDLSAVRPMIAMPFHPSNVYAVEDVCANPSDILREVEKEAREQGLALELASKVENGRLKVGQGVIAGCAGGTFDNLTAAADILRGRSTGNGEFGLSIYPSSQPVNLELTKNGSIAEFIAAGATVRTAFCGPCFGAGDVPANNELSIRHATRNFPNREGSKPVEGQIASVALMDARSIAATAINGGYLTPATALEVDYTKPAYTFDAQIYQKRCYFGFGKADDKEELRFGPNIADWPAMEPLADDLLLKVTSFITDPVTTTDELIPSGETSSYRSNPLKLAQFALSRKDPAYVRKSEAVQALQRARLKGEDPRGQSGELNAAFAIALTINKEADIRNTGIGSLVYANKPGDGSAREQAASCQKVLGTLANIAREYATKRYRSNLINWGMLPFLIGEEPPFTGGAWIYIPGIRKAVAGKAGIIAAYVLDGGAKPFQLTLGGLTDDERQIILDGCLINYYRSGK